MFEFRHVARRQHDRTGRIDDGETSPGAVQFDDESTTLLTAAGDVVAIEIDQVAGTGAIDSVSNRSGDLRRSIEQVLARRYLVPISVGRFLERDASRRQLVDRRLFELAIFGLASPERLYRRHEGVDEGVGSSTKIIGVVGRALDDYLEGEDVFEAMRSTGDDVAELFFRTQLIETRILRGKN